MKAGRGIIYSERTDEGRRRVDQRLFGIQTWVALPEADEESAPTFIHHGAGALPQIEAEGVSTRLIAGQISDARSPLITTFETLYDDIRLEAGVRLTILPSLLKRALYTFSSEVEVAGEAFAPAQLLVLRPGGLIDIRARSAA